MNLGREGKRVTAGVDRGVFPPSVALGMG